MTVVSINTCTTGSTGRIMLGIAQAARKSGFQYYTFSPKQRHDTSDTIADHCYFGHWLDAAVCVRLAALTGLNGCFSFYNTVSLLKKLKKIKPDIVHLHNLHDNYVNLKMLFLFIKKHKIKVLWTLHDCWSFTGGCPHFLSSECSGWQKNCSDCPGYSYPSGRAECSKAILKMKIKTFGGVDCMMIATPSLWLKQIAEQTFLNQYPICVIHNGIDCNVFKPTESNVRETYGIDKNKFVLLGVAYNWGKKKGLDVFSALSEQIDDLKYQIVLVGTDDTIDKQLPKNIVSIHKTQSKAELAAIYSTADLFVNPTREEVFGMVNIEALACGTPVITFRTGGSPECIDQTCGTVVDCDNFIELKEKIQQICELHEYTADMCMKRARAFDEKEIYYNYINIYRNMIKI